LTDAAIRSEIEAQYEARLAALTRERDEFKARAERAEHERNEFRKLYNLVLLELERMKRQLFGQKAETVDPAQVQLAFGPVLEALEKARNGSEGAAEQVESELAKLRERAEAEVARRKVKKEPKPHGRRDLSMENLPVELITLEPPERLLPGGAALVKIGEEISEHIDRRPASNVLVRVIRPKYKMPEAAPEAEAAPVAAIPESTGAGPGVDGAVGAEKLPAVAAAVVVAEPAKPGTKVPEVVTTAGAVPMAAVLESTGHEPIDGAVVAEKLPAVVVAERAKPGSIVIAELPERPIPRGIAGPGLLAYVLVSKFADHLPLHRQEKIFRREGLHLPRSTLCGLVQGSVVLLTRIVDAMWADAKATARWICIDATGVLVFAQEKCRRNHFWVLVAERDHVIFRYTKTHNGLDPAKLLEGYCGYVIADASSVYHELYRREPGIIEAGCWSHSRRGAFEALSSDKPRALVIIGFIRLLYDAHLLATDPKTGVTDGAKRKADAQPVIDRLYAWIAAELPKVADETPIAKAMNYIVNHRVPLTRFLDNGLLRLDNNLSELELRREKVGAHNWLYCGSDAGAHWNATAVSLIASCQLHGIEPWAYLRDVLTLLPSWSAKRVLDLAPKYWNETRQKPETQQRLAALRLLGRNDSSHAGESTAAA
jgi:transposase